MQLISARGALSTAFRLSRDHAGFVRLHAQRQVLKIQARLPDQREELLLLELHVRQDGIVEMFHYVVIA